MSHHWFAQPGAIWLMTALPFFSVIGIWAAWRRRQALAEFGGVTAALLGTARSPSWNWLRNLGLSFGLAALVLAIAGPQWGRDWSQSAVVGRDVVAVLDLSRSMLAESPSRLTRAKAALIDLSRTIQQRGGHRLALVAFAGRAKVICPLTHDYDHFREALAGLDAAEPPAELVPDEAQPSGTRLGLGLLYGMLSFDSEFRGDEAEAGQLLKAKRFPQAYAHAARYQDVLFLSDGDDPARDDEWRRILLEARKSGIPIHTIGIGDPQAASPIPFKDGYLTFDGERVQTRLQEMPLREIAERTGGSYTPAHTQAIPLGSLFRERIESRGMRDDQEAHEDALPVYRQRYAWFMLVSLVLLALEILVGRLMPRAPRQRTERAGSPRWLPAACLMLLALCLVSAVPMTDAQTLVRRGNEAFARGDYAAAVDLYTSAEERIVDPGLVAFNKGTALYRLGRHRDAELHFRRSLEDATGPRRARALYDLANCLVQRAEGRDRALLAGAEKLLEACLQEADCPADLDTNARHNLELTKLLIQQAIKAGSNSQNQEDDRDPRHRTPDPKNGTNDNNTTNPDPRTRPVFVKPDAGGDPIQTDLRQPGTGNLPVIPDRTELKPLSQEDALAHARDAAARVLRERQTYRIRSAKPAPAGVRDW